MIARNYIRHPEALRFQREMFSNGYHNSPRIMRLMEVICQLTSTMPQWVRDMKKRAADLVKHWKAAQIAINLKDTPKPPKMTPGFYYSPEGQTWSGRGLTPKWLRARIDSGDSKESFLYKGAC